MHKKDTSIWMYLGSSAYFFSIRMQCINYPFRGHLWLSFCDSMKNDGLKFFYTGLIDLVTCLWMFRL